MATNFKQLALLISTAYKIFNWNALTDYSEYSKEITKIQ